MVTVEMVRDWLLAYLNGEIDRAVLVEWAREVKLGGQVLSEDAEIVGPALARIGVAGKSGYDLTWHDCFDLLEELGYMARVIAEPIEIEEKYEEDGEENESDESDESDE
ncbi:MAG: hypothetical protein JXB47_17405 [Anaerolineae bacterium]|nr:hypothetical protein [Anaerolineae bacterium]